MRELISEEKLRRFRSDDGSWNDASERYIRAVAEAARLYPLFHLLEVWFRNRVHQAIGKIVQEPDWLTAASSTPDAFAADQLKRIWRERGAEIQREQ